MSKDQTLQSNPDELLRCEERSQSMEHRKDLTSFQRSDAALQENVSRTLWKDIVLRARDYFEIGVQVRNGVVYLVGHVRGTTSQSRIKHALQTVPGILGIKNYLVLDDQLTLEVATSLAYLEHTYNCKFFTGASQGVIYLSGNVSTENVSLLAEKCAAGNPKVRGVINKVRVSGAELALQDPAFLQPTIGESIYFLDGVSGVVKQVIINPNNRRVEAITVRGCFYDAPQNPTLSNNSIVPSPEQLLVIPMNVMGHMTTSSGFATIQSTDSEKYQVFDASLFTAPNEDWVPPYPYCPAEVLLPVDNQLVDNLNVNTADEVSVTLKQENLMLAEQILANDSLGG